MTPDTQAAADRLAAFADAWAEETDTGDGAQQIIQFARGHGGYPTLTLGDLRTLLAALDPADQPIPHVPTQAGLDYLAIRRQQNPRGADQ